MVSFGKVNYVLEGNINYTEQLSHGCKDLGLIASAKETEELAKSANPGDTTYLVPAFTGLGALTGTVKRKLLSAESPAQQVRQSW